MGRKTPQGLLLLLAGVAVAFGVGAAIGWVSAVPDCDCAPCTPLTSHAVPPVPIQPDRPDSARAATGRPRAGFGCDPSELAALRQEIETLRGRRAALEHGRSGSVAEEAGTPLAWPAHIPEQYRPEHFQALFAQALDEIEAPAKLVGFDCTEPPCIAQLRLEQGRWVDVSRSEVWRANFASVTREISTYARCKDGRQERIQLMAPLWDWQHDPKSMSSHAYQKLVRAAGLKVWEGQQSEEEANRDRRLRLRLEAIQDSWRCAPAP